ncbi:hypothetical protein SAMN05660964_00378 [Thiothrix caldifontis]|uniref:Uncharacterized protein n=1 Tax=Thiothrix caldifontis TaxID=525918 RepID=A0A1H3WBJ2_9GAMM|nr:hypothetical protein [Thiothrix caldifontis]SDZ84476.1 hypothetical protein SAMN05660964_00378 [Thiothrix caldifontis]
MTNIIFSKTFKGIEEVETKANGLSRLERWVLIYIDGKRTFEELQTLPRVDDLGGILNFLEVGGYIAPINHVPKGVSTPSTTQQISATEPSLFRELPATFDPAKFNMAKNFMMNSLNAFKGAYGATNLVRSIDHCQTHAELRALFEQWHEEIANTRQGQKQGKDLREKLLVVI